MKLKKISLLVLFVLTIISCEKEKSVSVDFPEGIISYNYALGTENIQGQTPINLENAITEKISTKDLEIHYNSIILSSVQNTVENLKINLSDEDKVLNYITIKGLRYELQQFHFHHHSEHTVNGQYSEMEIHFVHKSSTGAYAVLGVLVKEGQTINSSLKTLISDSPDAIGISSYNTSFDLNAILPLQTNKYFTYSGSLTTPNMDTTPNQGPLTWIVFKNNITLTAAQVEEYKLKYEEDNFRVIQPLNNRTVYENN
ncbi:carbonic anhydrase family protein [Flavobacterium lacustre]|uniref:carbonic anhydrase family protein n=1 Tax=Flavobacterium lacustre TaxID=3016339 RepID=UPI0022B6DB73|nr:carbonic anhydrase family protein [Flavobacterium lacustre]